MSSQKTHSSNTKSTLLVSWLVILTAATGIIAYVQLNSWNNSAACGHGKNILQDDDATVPKSDTASMEKLVQILTDRLDERTSHRARRSLPTSASSTSSPTLLVSLLEELIADSLTQVCGASDKICLPGPDGRKGEQGQPGWPGHKGRKGSPGVLGLPGPTGNPGSRGARGAKGRKGDTGVKGEHGDVGARGPVGEKGAVGEKGRTGNRGDTGFPGFNGQKGERGVYGLRGEKGEKGSPGGEKGERGVDGSRGEKGEKGNVGSVGDKGDKGLKGVPILLPSHLFPSECSNYTVLGEPWRRVSQTNNGEANRCDSNLSGWKRFADDVGGKMPETCPSTHNRCGTDAPGWLNGAHPTRAGQKASMRVCFRHGSSCCQWSTSVEVTNCGSYFVYNLRNSPSCNLVYCGDA